METGLTALLSILLDTAYTPLLKRGLDRIRDRARRLPVDIVHGDKGTAALTSTAALAMIAAGTCADELCLTGNARRNQAIEVAFQASLPAAAQLFDGALHDRKSLAMKRDGTVRVTFAEPVVVSRVVLSYYNDPKRSYNAARDAVVRLWQGGAPVGDPVTVPIDGDPQMRIGTHDQLVWAGRAEARLAADRPATSVTVDVRKMPGAHQALIRELQV